MLRKMALAATLCCALACAVTACWSQGITYSSRIYHYKIKLPAGWKQIEPEYVQRLEEFANSAAKGQAPRIVYEAGFQIADRSLFQYPYVLVQQHARGTPAFSQLAAELTEENLSKLARNLNRLLAGMVANAKMKVLRTDLKRHMVLLNLECQVTGVGSVKALIAFCLGRDGIAQLNCYSLSANYARDLPAFQSIIDSLAYDPGYEYSQAQEPTSRARGFGRDVGTLAVVGSLIAWVLSRNRRARRKKDEAPPNDPALI